MNEQIHTGEIIGPIQWNPQVQKETFHYFYGNLATCLAFLFQKWRTWGFDSEPPPLAPPISVSFILHIEFFSIDSFLVCFILGDFVIVVRFYFGLYIFVNIKTGSLSNFSLFVISLNLLHISLYFCNTFSSSTKKEKVLASSKFFRCLRYPLIFRSKTHNGVTPSLCL